MTVDQFVKRYSLDRKNSTSLKWDLLGERFGDPDLIPMCNRCTAPQSVPWCVRVCIYPTVLLRFPV